MIEHSLSDHACVAWFEYRIGYLATLVPVGSMHRLYMYFTQENNVHIFIWREPHQCSANILQLV